MTRYIRLGYLVPRLVLLLVLVGLVEFGSGWVARVALIAAGENAIGARVELGETTVSLLNAKATVADARIANPRRPMENLIEADRIELDFDADSLLRRRAIADRGVVRGLRFGVPRETSGALDPKSEEDAGGTAPAWLGDSAQAAIDRAADAWIDDLEKKLSAEADDFESVRLANELAETWPARYEAISGDAEHLGDEIQALRQTALEARDNPLRHAEFLRTAPQRAAEFKARLAALRDQLSGLPAELAADKQRIEGARIRDEQRLRERLQVDQLDPNSLTSQLLGERVTESLQELIGWVRWTRQMIPSRSAPRATTPRSRGVDVHFVGVRRRPDLLIRELELAGTARLAGGPVELAGVVRDFTTSPVLHGEPMHVELATTGALPMRLRATIDRTTASPTDELLVDCPAIELPAARLGDASRLAVEMAPSTASLNVSLRLVGERLSGDVQLVQDRVALAPRVGDDASGLVRRLGSLSTGQMAALNKPATRVTLSGTLDDPKMAIWSTLGPAIAESLETAAKSVAQAEAQRQLESVRGRVADEIGSLDRVLAEATGRLANEIDAPQQEIERLASRLIGGQLGRGTFSFEQLGKRLPTGQSLFK